MISMIPFDRRKIGLFIRKKDSEVSFLSVTRVEKWHSRKSYPVFRFLPKAKRYLEVLIRAVTMNIRNESTYLQVNFQIIFMLYVFKVEIELEPLCNDDSMVPWSLCNEGFDELFPLISLVKKNLGLIWLPMSTVRMSISDIFPDVRYISIYLWTLYLHFLYSKHTVKQYLYSTTCLIHHLSNPFRCVIRRQFSFQFDNILCVFLCITRYAVYSDTTPSPPVRIELDRFYCI